MKEFLNENFLLQTDAAVKLYHDYSKDLPIIDYHCHLSPAEIAEDKTFRDITEVWLEGDHYKWRAMRANGVDEKYCTGDAPAEEKFRKWAETVPYTLRNPLYHWTHLELKRYFDIDVLLDKKSADKIFDETSEKLQSDDYSVRNLLRKMNVEAVCTTDDPIDSLEHHQKIQKDGFEIKVLPTWRPDKAMAVENPSAYKNYIEQLSKAADTDINEFKNLLDALKKRHDFFDQMGCRLSDHGIENFYAADFTDVEIENTFTEVLRGKIVSKEAVEKFKTALLLHFAEMDHEKGWTQQFHIGALRNNNSRMYEKLGPDKGFDSIGDFTIAKPMSKFLDTLESQGKLAKTIVYNLNPRDNELIATMMGNFNDGSVPGKMQFGSGWWFLDQKDGIEKQLDALSNLGLLSRFVGMLTDSRSFLSYPRHEYFRRVLSNLVGEDMQNGELPNEYELVGKMISDISYHNAKNYFNF